MNIRDKVKTTKWTRADVLKINFNDPTTTHPLVANNFPSMSEDVFIWNTMPLRKLDGNIVSVNGWSVIFTLTADRLPNNYKDADGNYDVNADWTDRHSRAKICFWFSKDSKSWIFGGRVMAEGISPTTREWAGTPILVNNEGDIDLYYTCMNPGATISKVTGKISTSSKGVKLSGFDNVISLFSADGVYYQNESQNPYWNFRDPSPFIDPNDGNLYMLFEGNVSGSRGSHYIKSEDIGNIPPGYNSLGGSNYQVGCVGLAVSKDRDGNNWEILPPLISSVGVNDQTERPHFVFKDDKYYLFTISHKFTFAEGLSGPDGVYGFVSNSLFGPYEPLNGSGLVIGNPSSQPFQAYSHYVMPNELITSFIDTVPMGNGKYRVGGTEARTIQIKIDGTRTFIVNEFDYGYIPPMENVNTKTYAGGLSTGNNFIFL